MRYHVTHLTAYDYSESVSLCHNQVHLTPRTVGRQRCEHSVLEVSPAPAKLEAWQDYFGNRVHYFSVEGEHRQLLVAARSVVEVGSSPALSPSATPSWERVRDQVSGTTDEACLEAAQFTFASPYVRCSQEPREYAAVSCTPGRPLLEAVLDLTGRIYREFRYDPTATTVHTPTAEVLRQRRGVCQDFAHLQLACLRSLGLPARYVSGYLLTDPPPGQPKLIGADASHAWLAVFCPGLGWVDVDPTNNELPSLRHVTLAWGRDYGDVCPIQGVFIGGGQHAMRVSVDVSHA